jgi:hypothetical protein
MAASSAYRAADLQGVALRQFLRVVEQRLRPHGPGSVPSARIGTVAFIHRFGSTLNARLRSTSIACEAACAIRVHAPA